MPTNLNCYAKVGKEKRNLAEGPQALKQGYPPCVGIASGVKTHKVFERDRE